MKEVIKWAYCSVVAIFGIGFIHFAKHYGWLGIDKLAILILWFGICGLLVGIGVVAGNFDGFRALFKRRSIRSIFKRKPKGERKRIGILKTTMWVIVALWIGIVLIPGVTVQIENRGIIKNLYASSLYEAHYRPWKESKFGKFTITVLGGTAFILAGIVHLREGNRKNRKGEL